MKNLNIKLNKKQNKYKNIFIVIILIIIFQLTISATLQSYLYVNNIKIQKNTKELDDYETDILSKETEISIVLNLKDNMDFIKENGYEYDNHCVFTD